MISYFDALYLFVLNRRNDEIELSSYISPNIASEKIFGTSILSQLQRRFEIMAFPTMAWGVIP